MGGGSVSALALLLLMATPAAGDPLIVAVVPDLSGPGPGDEGLALAATETVDVSGWRLSDSEGAWRIPAGTVLGPEPAWLVGDPEPWRARDGPAPLAVFGPALQLANNGDDVHLLDPNGRTVDTFLYGDETTPAWGKLGVQSPDLVYKRLEDGGWQDSDTAADWQTPRMHRMGESQLDAPVFVAERVQLYASPDSSFETIAALLAGAEKRIHLHVYELRSQLLADALVAAAPGLDVQILVTERPVGQEPRERAESAAALQRLDEAGAEAWLAGSGRYRFHHLKVLVVDDAVAVQSENWVPAGIPADPSWGNRGWGIVVHGGDIANWFAHWMAQDRAAWDTRPFDLATYHPLHEPPPRFASATGTHLGIPALDVPGPVQVQPVISPDHTHDPDQGPLLLAARSATSRLWVQQLDVSTDGANALGWQALDGLRESLRAAGRGGVDARVVAAAPFRFDDTGNAEAMAALPADGVAACTFAVPDLVLHNKGVIADDTVYVGSMNGNHHSRSQNREVGVLVDDPRVARYFAGLYEHDWRHCAQAPAQELAAPVPTLLLAGIVAAVRLCSPSSPSRPLPSSPSP